MTNYLLNDYDLSKLFDSKNKLISFSEDPRNHVPTKGFIIYAIWDNDDKFIYVGISGLQSSKEKRNPLSRIVSQRSGRRSGDQFYVYVHDYFVIPELIREGTYEPSKGFLDEKTKHFIQKNLSYRFCDFVGKDSKDVVRGLESKIKNGMFGLKSLLNG